MKILVTGVKGQLGHDVVKELALNGIEAVPCDREEFDLTNREETQNFIFEHKPDGIIHCAAYTAVDKAEENEELADIVYGNFKEKSEWLEVPSEIIQK